MSGTLVSYVRNRVSKIHDVTEPKNWQHVRTLQNPADLISSRIIIQQLSTSQMCWIGPNFMNKLKSEWLKNDIVFIENPPEIKRNKLVLTMWVDNNQLLERYSSWTLLVGTTAWINRSTTKVKTNINNRKATVEGKVQKPLTITMIPLAVDELQ